MFSKPEGWSFSVRGLASQVKEGKTSVSKSLKRLIERGWLARNEIRTDGRYTAYEYEIKAIKGRGTVSRKTDTPSAKPDTEKRTGRKNLTKGGYLAVAKQLFLAAYQKKVWGLGGADLSQRKLAEWLTLQGYKTSVSAVKNGTREEPVEHLVPATDEVVAFLDKMKERFPGLETERFLIH